MSRESDDHTGCGFVICMFVVFVFSFWFGHAVGYNSGRDHERELSKSAGK